MAEPSTDPDPVALERYEQRFRRAGLPLFIDDFNAEEDVYNRAVPLLALVFLAEVLGATQLDWSFVANLGAALGGLAIVLVALGIFNRSRGRRFVSIPEDVEAPELAAFVVIPAVLPIIFGGQWVSALVTVLANLLLLAAVYAIVALGVLSIFRWIFERGLRQLRASVGLLARAVPLLLIFVLLAFVNTEMWQVFASVPYSGLIVIGAIFVGLGTSFLLARLPREVRELESESVEQHPLLPRQRLNVGTVLFLSQVTQVLTVTLLVGAFFVVFGVLAVNEGVRESWLGEPGNELVSIELFGDSYALTEELLRVAGGLAAFSGLYFAVAMLTDATYREEFLAELTDEMRESFRLRAAYLRQLHG